jgi:hypothetical protein
MPAKKQITRCLQAKEDTKRGNAIHVIGAPGNLLGVIFLFYPQKFLESS